MSNEYPFVKDTLRRCLGTCSGRRPCGACRCNAVLNIAELVSRINTKDGCLVPDVSFQAKESGTDFALKIFAYSLGRTAQLGLGNRMAENGAAEPAQIALLTKAVMDYCAKHQIVRIDHREQVAGRVVRLFDRGVTDFDQIAFALEKDEAMARLRRTAQRLSQPGIRRKS